ncbi:MAG: AAA family ATPase [Cyanobacteria bacterium P01_D01_bin.1]
MALSTSPLPSSLAQLRGYTFVEQLYLGTRTAVYRMVQTAQQRPVVVKVLRRDYPSFAELVQFRNQYAIAKSLPIPGIIRPTQLEPLGSGYALVMEDWGGLSLAKYAQHQRLSLTEVLSLAIQVSDILHDLCQHRVVHKDIKPANILIHPESKQVKLIDFSIASLLPKETQEIQCPNVLEGTLAYLAPEQTGRMNRGVDYRADFYAFGVTLYQLLTGRLPFTSEDPLELVHCHIAKSPQPAHQVNPDIPKMVAAITSKLMAKNAEDRYQSALGLKHDLEQCLTQWKATQTVTAFELGQRDLSHRFLIPEKLYGRESEVKTLLAAFERAAEGSSELMLVAGFSGIGKTAVVNEIHKPVTRQYGYFIKGKFDQFNRSTPLSAFVQAMRDLMAQLLSESDAQLAVWKSRILEVVGENGQVLIEVIPELAKVIGEQSAATELAGSAAQNRFNLLLKGFVEVFATVAHPLVLFLDDLQWADSASLELIKLLIDGSGYLLVLGAYRDNEVSSTHPFALSVEAFKQAGKIVNTITLKPLTAEDTKGLVADTLNCSTELAQPLSALVYRKTKGNPFFLTRFLQSLHQEGHIQFAADQGCWQCDIAKVNVLALTDDVVEFMALQLNKLPAKTQQILQLAACIGNQFDLTTLSVISKQPNTEVAIALWEALQAGLITPTNRVYKFFLPADQTDPNQTAPNQTATEQKDTEQKDTERSVNPTYRFLHDRVQQAAYSLISGAKCIETHLKIGQRLLTNTHQADLDASVFKIVEHLNIGLPLVTEASKKQEIADLNRLAGHKARASFAYESALNYFTTGIELLCATSWEDQYDLTLALYEGASESACLIGHFDIADEFIQTVLSKAKTVLDQVKVFQVKIQGYTSRGNAEKAIQTALVALEKLDIVFPNPPSPDDIGQHFGKVAASLADKKIEDLVHLPQMSDPKSLAIMQVLCSIIAAAATSSSPLFPLIILTQVELSIRLGNANVSPFSYGMYGVFLCAQADSLETSYRFGQLATNLLSCWKNTPVKSSTLYIVNHLINHWREPIRDSLQPFQAAYVAGFENGDLEHAAWSLAAYSANSLIAGLPLERLEEDFARHAQMLAQTHQTWQSYVNSISRQVVANLKGDSSEPWRLAGTYYSEETMVPVHTQMNDRGTLSYLYMNKLIIAVLFRDYAQARQYIEEARDYPAGAATTPQPPVINFYSSLVACHDYAKSSLCEQTTLEQTTLWADLTAAQAQLQQWASHAPENYLHKFYLVEAEMQRIAGNKALAIDLYDQAIAGAKANEYIQEEALANELAAEFYLSWGKEKIAQAYLVNAYYGYAHWHSDTKVHNLERRYPNLLAPICQRQQPALSTTETVFTVDSPLIHRSVHQSAHPSTHRPIAKPTVSGTTTVSASLDLASILKVSQALSSEIYLDKLLSTLLRMVLESAGASKGVLLMPQAEQWFVEAIARSGQPTQVESVMLCDDTDLPRSLVDRVKRSLQSVVIADAMTDTALATDGYVVQQQPKSLLCTPILHQGKLVAILYLENQIAAGAFTRDRITLLNILCTQAAISIETAKLYSQSQIEQRRLTTLLSNLPGMAYSCDNDADWTMKVVSEGCFLLTGYQADELVGNRRISYGSLIHPDDTEMIDTAVQAALDNRTHFQTSYRIRTRQGQEKWVWEQGKGVFDQAGTLLFIEGFITDISDRKAAENLVQEKNESLLLTMAQLQESQSQVVQAEKMSALGNLVAGVAHEINNPIGFLSGSVRNAKDYVQDLLEHLALYQQHYPNAAEPIQEHAEDIDLDFLNEDVTKLIDSMQKATKRIESISTSLRTFSRSDAENKIPANIYEGIDSTILILKYRLKASEHRPAIQIDKGYSELPNVQCFPGQLNQVFMNILANAIDMFDEAARESTFAELKANPQIITVRSELTDENTAEIRIADNGTGMSDAVKSRIFDHLFTTKGVGRGTGLGLAIAHQIVVEKHGGSLEVVSELGQGTEFVMRLPIL